MEQTDIGNLWPTPHQLLLLKAALLRDEPALDAWAEWKVGVDIDSLDWGSQRLLPKLYKNLHSHGIEEPLVRKFKGFHRRTWCENQLKFRKLAPALQVEAELVFPCHRNSHAVSHYTPIRSLL